MLKKCVCLLAMLLAFASFAAVDVNKASAADLDSIKGLGPSLSGKILDERKKSSFKDWPDLINRVSGFGEKSAVKYSAQGLTVNGSSFKGGSDKTAGKNEKSPKGTKEKPAGADIIAKVPAKSKSDKTSTAVSTPVAASPS